MEVERGGEPGEEGRRDRHLTRYNLYLVVPSTKDKLVGETRRLRIIMCETFLRKVVFRWVHWAFPGNWPLIIFKFTDQFTLDKYAQG